LVYWPKGNFYNFADEIVDFSDTAAIIENLDLILSVDTSTLHLSAAMGKPTFLINRYNTCWRWMLDTEKSPWYRSLKIFRQDETMDWQAVLQRLNLAVDRLAKEHAQQHQVIRSTAG